MQFIMITYFNVTIIIIMQGVKGVTVSYMAAINMNNNMKDNIRKAFQND